MRLYPALVILSIVSMICAKKDMMTSFPANYVGPGINTVYCKVESYNKFAVNRAREKSCQRLAYRNSRFKWPFFKFFQYPKVYNPPPEDRFTIPGLPYFLYPMELRPSHKLYPNFKDFVVVNEKCQFVGAVTQIKERPIPEDDGKGKGCIGRICQYFRRPKLWYKKCGLKLNPILA